MRATALLLIIAFSAASARLIVPPSHFQETANQVEAVDFTEFTKGFLEGAFNFIDMEAPKCAKALQNGFVLGQDLFKEISESIAASGFSMPEIQKILTRNLPKIIIRMNSIRSNCDGAKDDIQAIIRLFEYTKDPVAFVQLIIAFGLNPLYYPRIIGDLSSIAEGVITENWHDAGFAAGDLLKGLMMSAP